jgi:hypothetical protein
MSDIVASSISYPPFPPAHLGTSDSLPHEYLELLVDPVSVEGSALLEPVTKGGKFYCKLYELDDGQAPSAQSGPRYFGVAFRFGITDIRTVNVFCHPSPGHAGMSDQEYLGLTGSWRSLYRYMQYFGVQLAAGRSNIVFVMPMFSVATWSNLGIFRQHWRAIINAILVEVQRVVWPGPADMPRNPTALENIILSDFSAGRYAMNAMCSAPGIHILLREIWDFDGAGPAPHAAGKLLSYDQGEGPAAPNRYHVPLPRWAKFPFYDQHPAKHSDYFMFLHGHIPQRLVFHATQSSTYGR